jgi:uncharacterized protein (DUF1697 family)
MTQAIVLLRGVNVGGHHRVPMAAFRELLGSLGMKDVRTLLNSGNAVGRVRARASDRFARTIRAALVDTMQVDVPVVVVPADTFEAIVADNPIETPSLDASQLLVAFTQDPAALQPLNAITPQLVGDEQFVVGSHAAYLYCAQGIQGSKAANALLGRVGHSVTTRNWATVNKLQALLSPTRS